MLKAKDRLPPGCPAARERPPPSSSETRPRCPAFGAPPKAQARPLAPSFNSAEGQPSTARLCAARAARHRHGNLLFRPLSPRGTAETQSVSELVTAQVKAALRGLSFLTIVLCAIDCFLQLEKPTRAFQTFSPPLLVKRVSASDHSPPWKCNRNTGGRSQLQPQFPDTNLGTMLPFGGLSFKRYRSLII